MNSRQRRGGPSVLVGGTGIVRGPFVLKSGNLDFNRLFLQAARRPPDALSPITTVRSVALSRRVTAFTVGLTRYLIPDDPASRPRQTITFYSPLLDPLSRPAATAVIAHELAHAWLNEHVKPEESLRRENEADDLAREWGFGDELRALDSEAETVNLS